MTRPVPPILPGLEAYWQASFAQRAEDAPTSEVAEPDQSRGRDFEEVDRSAELEVDQMIVEEHVLVAGQNFDMAAGNSAAVQRTRVALEVVGY